MPIVQVIVDESTSKVIAGVYQWDRASGGIFVPPSGSAFPASPQEGEWFFRTDEGMAYRYSGSVWEAQAADAAAHDIAGQKHTGQLPHSSLSGIVADDHHPHPNKAQLDLVTDGDHDVRADNPHGVSPGQIGAATTSHASSHLPTGSDPVARQAELICVRESNNGQNLAAGGTVIEFDTTHLNTAPSLFTRLGSTEIQFETAGLVDIMAKVTVRQTAGTGRTISILGVEYSDDGGSSWTLVPGAGGALYTRNNTDGHYGTLVASVRGQVGVGDRVRVYGERLAGTGTIALVANGSNLGITWWPL